MIGLRGWQGDGVEKKVRFRCSADKDGCCPFTDASLLAKWRSTLLTHQQHMSQLIDDGGYWSVFWSLPAFQLSYIVLDLMHVCDLLGITQYLLGNILLECFFSMGGVLNKAKGTLSEIVVFVKLASKRLGYEKPPLNKLTMGMLKPEGSSKPRLKLKASDSRLMVAVVYFMLTELFPAKSDYEKMRLQCLESLHRFYKALPRSREADDGDEFMASALGRLARQHVILYGELSRHPDRPRRWEAYRMYPKHHLFIHLAEVDYKVHGNPRENWNYEDEDMIGLCVGTVSGSSQNSGYIHRPFIEKYRI